MMGVKKDFDVSTHNKRDKRMPRIVMDRWWMNVWMDVWMDGCFDGSRDGDEMWDREWCGGTGSYNISLTGAAKYSLEKHAHGG